VKELPKRGVSLAIDDFGTGYSGLSYLKVFDIDTLKIDRSFIQDVHINAESATIVLAILAMAKAMGIKTLAEGVEKKEELQFLQENGCDFIQGFYFSTPVNVDEFTKLLLKGNGFFDVS
jgi:EAL domain-containing protein (putative c-di-GMP-specific phosphodiesterase class I)